MFRAQNHVTLALIKIALNRQTGVYFNSICSLLMGFIKHMKLLILDIFNFAANPEA